MKYINKWLIALAFCTVFSCHKGDSARLVEFTGFRPITGQEVMEGKQKGLSIFIVDTLLLVSLPNKADSLYSVYGLSSNRYLGSLIKKGKDMEPFGLSLCYGQFEKDAEGIKIWVADYNTMEMVLVNVNGSLKNGETIIAERVPMIHNEIPEPTFIFPLSNGKLLGFHNVVKQGQQQSDERIFLLDPKKAQVQLKRLPVIPTADSMSTTYRKKAYSAMARLKPDGKRLVEMKRLQPLVNLLDTDGNVVASLRFEKQYPTMFDMKTLASTEYMTYGLWLEASDNYIYALGSRLIREGQNQIVGRVIRILDWKGNAVQGLSISQNIYAFAVDEQHRVIYGLASAEQKLFKYHF